MSVSGDPTIAFSALPYAMESLEPPEEVLLAGMSSVRDRYAMRAQDLPRSKGVYLHIDFGQAGIGGDNSWGKRAYSEYTLQELEYRYRFQVTALLQPLDSEFVCDDAS